MAEPVVTLTVATTADTSNLAGVQLSSALAGFRHIFPDSIPKPTMAELEVEWRGLLEDPGRTVVMASLSGDAVGAVVYGRDYSDEMGTDSVLLKLYVSPAGAGRGIGSRLHDRAVGDLRAAGFSRARLWVLERNIIARRMYERRGWKLEPWSRTDWPGSGILELGYSLDVIGYSSAI